RVARLDPADQVLGVPHRERGLAGDGNPLAPQLKGVDVLRVLYEVHLARRLPHHAFRLGMSLAPDVDHVVTLAGQVGDQFVRPDDVRARGVDRLQPQLDRALLDLRRHAVRGEYDGALFDLVQPGKP